MPERRDVAAATAAVVRTPLLRLVEPTATAALVAPASRPEQQSRGERTRRTNSNTLHQELITPKKDPRTPRSCGLQGASGAPGGTFGDSGGSNGTPGFPGTVPRLAAASTRPPTAPS